MMRAVLYVCHGSRLREAQVQVAEFMSITMSEIKAPIQEYCFLELANPSMQEGVARCIERGATSIKVIPFLLLLTGHAKRDIPEQLNIMKKQYPNITFTYGAPLGIHDALIQIIIERMLEQQPTIEKDAHVLLVGRGSSDPITPVYFQKIESRLKHKTAITNISTCYLAACQPDFETGLSSVLEQNPKQLFIVPYLLFTGVLMQRLEQRIEQLSNRNIYLCRHLYFHKNIVHVLSERVRS